MISHSRLSIFTAISICLIAASGCKSLLGNNAKDVAPKPTGAIPERSAAELVEHLNRQANYLQSISYTDVSVSASENGREMPRLSDSSLYAAQPKNFRLMCGTFATSGEVDLGSNDREFWMYVKRLDGPNYFYCSHDEFARGAAKKFPIPFDTDWVMQALGMATYPPDGQYESKINTQQRAYVLYQKTQTRAGQPVTKLTAFNVDWEQGRKPIVRKHAIFDEKNTLLASAEIISAKTVTVGHDRGTGHDQTVQVPTEVVLEWPGQKFKMTLKMDKEKVNEDFGQRQAMLFTRPQIRGTNPIDLATWVTPSSYRGQVR